MATSDARRVAGRGVHTNRRASGLINPPAWGYRTDPQGGCRLAHPPSCRREPVADAMRGESIQEDIRGICGERSLCASPELEVTESVRLTAISTRNAAAAMDTAWHSTISARATPA